MKPLWIGKYIIVESLGKERLRLQNADSGKKLANTYHASNVKLRPKHDDGSDNSTREDEIKYNTTSARFNPISRTDREKLAKAL